MCTHCTKLLHDGYFIAGEVVFRIVKLTDDVMFLRSGSRICGVLFRQTHVCVENSSIPLIICFFLQHFKQILIRETEKDRAESSKEVDFFREKYMPLKCLKQVGFVAFSPDSKQAYNPWLSLRFTVLGFQVESQTCQKISSELFTGNLSFAKTLFQLVVCSLLQHKCQR